MFNSIKKNVQSELLLTLTSHGIKAELHNEMVYVPAKDIWFTSDVEEQTNKPELVIICLHVLVYSKCMNINSLIESHAGIGANRKQAILDAFAKFLEGSFHVLLETVLSDASSDLAASTHHSLVQKVNWQTSKTSWNIYQSFLYSRGESAVPNLSNQLKEFFQSLQKLNSALEPGKIHWLRVFIGMHEGQIMAVEILLNNKTWTKAEALGNKFNWELTQEYNTLRLFAVFVPIKNHPAVELKASFFSRLMSKFK